MDTSALFVSVKTACRRIIDLQRFCRFSLLDACIRLRQTSTVPGTLLVVHLQGIGDYLLFRNVLRALKNSRRFKEYRITLCGSAAFRDLAETYDRDTVSDFIWVSTPALRSKAWYRWTMLSAIRKRGFDTVLYPVFSRESLAGDSIVRVSGAPHACAWRGDDVHSPFWEHAVFNRYYTELFDLSPGTTFEFYRNKEFVEHVTGEPAAVRGLSLPSMDDRPAAERYAVLCPGALLAKKRWPLKRFIELAGYLHSAHNLTSVIVGDRNDIPSPGLKRLMDERPYIRNLIAQTTLSETMRIVRGAVLVVTNDTSISHAGAALGRPVVICSNGEHYGRFSEYPKEICPTVWYAYPPAIAGSGASFDELVRRFRYGSRLDIGTISLETVERLADRALGAGPQIT